MPTPVTLFKVFVASPNDVEDARRVARQVVFEWNDLNAEHESSVALPIGWETHSFPASGEHPQRIIDAQALDGCDLLIAVFWSKLGEETPDAQSGTVGEIEKHIRSGKQAMIYFSRADLPQTHDREQFYKVQQFEKSVQKRVLYGTYAKIDEFKEKLTKHLVQAIRSESKRSRAPRPAAVPKDDLSEDATRVILEATRPGASGILLYVDGYPQAVAFMVNDKQFVENDGADKRDILRWHDVLEELDQFGLLNTVQSGRDTIEATVNSRGYKLAEQIRAKQQAVPVPASGIRKCPGCGESMKNLNTDPSQPADWECGRPRCLNSYYHQDAKCKTCGKRPAEITQQGTGFTEYLCEDGHEFRVHASEIQSRKKRLEPS